MYSDIYILAGRYITKHYVSAYHNICILKFMFVFKRDGVCSSKCFIYVFVFTVVFVVYVYDIAFISHCNNVCISQSNMYITMCVYHNVCILQCLYITMSVYHASIPMYISSMFIIMSVAQCCCVYHNVAMYITMLLYHDRCCYVYHNNFISRCCYIHHKVFISRCCYVHHKVFISRCCYIHHKVFISQCSYVYHNAFISRSMLLCISQ